jgi:glutamine---fructose-6-phosphate transaminase (isomerizing)
MKHGPIALIDPNTPTVFLVPQDSMYDKTMANLAMIRARKGPIIALATEGDKQIKKVADDVIYLPKALEPIYPILAPCRCNCSPITSPSRAAATWTSRATWPRA